MVPSTQSHICPSIICSGRSSASKGLFGGAPAALAPSTVTEYCREAAGPSKRWLLRLLHFAVVFCQSRSRPAARYSAAQCYAVHLRREPEPARAGAKQPRSTGVPATYFLLFGDVMLLLWTQYTCKYLRILFFFQISSYFVAV
jgi:hypothetical protein